MRYFLGNLLIVLSLLILVVVYYPIILTYFNSPSLKTEFKEGIYITIPKIKAQSPVIANVDPWNEAVYRSQLKKGVAHAKGTVLPGQAGTSFLFAHSSDLPWNLSRYNTIFLRLGEVEEGDQIIINKEGQEFKYRVREKKVVWPQETKYLTDETKSQLILQTCTPIGTAFKRLLVFADPI